MEVISKQTKTKSHEEFEKLLSQDLGNRKFKEGGIATGIIEGLPGAFDWKTTFFLTSTDDHVFLGNPVRDEILNIDKITRSFPDKTKKPRIFSLPSKYSCNWLG